MLLSYGISVCDVGQKGLSGVTKSVQAGGGEAGGEPHPERGICVPSRGPVLVLRHWSCVSFT